MKVKFDEAKADLTAWNFGIDAEECLTQLIKPLVARISAAIDEEMRKNTHVSLGDRTDGGPVIGIIIPMDGGDDGFGADVSLDELVEDCISSIDDSPPDLRDWIAHMRRYLGQFEAALKRAEGDPPTTTS